MIMVESPLSRLRCCVRSLLPITRPPDATKAPLRLVRLGGLETDLEPVPMLVSLYLRAYCLQDGERGDTDAHPVPSDVLLDIITRLEEGLLRPCFFHAIDSHIHRLVVMMNRIVPRPSI